MIILNVFSFCCTNCLCIFTFSAGIGRSGTFVMVDSILKEVAIDNIYFLHHWKFKKHFFYEVFVSSF